MATTLIEKLRSIIRGEVDATDTTLDRYSHDASLFEMRPQVVVFPKDTEDIKKLVAYASESHTTENPISLTARAGGTDMTGGSLSDSVLLDFTRYFTHIKNVGEGSAIVEPGVWYRDFEKATLARGYIMPSYPASREICTVGGMVANNSGGEKTLAYGKTERYVKHLTVVLADGHEYEIKPLTLAELSQKESEQSFEGDVYRSMHTLIENNYDRIMAAKPNVSKNSSGYYLWNVFDREKGIFDLTKLFVGSQGTLGLITEIEFSLIRPKPYSRLLIMFLPSLNPLAQIINTVLSHKPESFESYDDHTFSIAVKYIPQLIRQLKGNLISLAFQFLPEFFAALTGGIPKLVLLAEFTGDTDTEAEQKARAAMTDIQKFNIKMRVTKTAAEAEKYWIIRRESFNLLRTHTKKLRTAPFIDDIVVRPEKLSDFLPKLYAILNQYKQLTYTIAGHAGDGNFHIIPLMDLKDPHSTEIIKELSEKIYPLVAKFGGSPSGEHNDGLIRTPFLPLFFGKEIYQLFEETKRIFDPKGIFNPHKKIDVSLEYIFKHIAH